MRLFYFSEQPFLKNINQSLGCKGMYIRIVYFERKKFKSDRGDTGEELDYYYFAVFA